MNVNAIAQKLKEAGIENSRAEARYLVMAVLGVDPLLSDFDTNETLQSATEKRCARVPLSKIIGKREFYGRDFIVNEHVLDPRSDSEILIEEALKIMPDNALIYDLGTGSGCLLLTLLAERQDASGVAIDVSKDALKVAQQNAYNLECTDGVQFIEAGFADFLPNEKANLLISNPPYIETATIEGLEPEVKNHDPHMALDGGADGMIFYKQILDRLSLILLSDSYFLLEIDDVVCDKVMDHAVALGHYNLEIIKDLAGHNRVLKGQCVALTV